MTRFLALPYVIRRRFVRSALFWYRPDDRGRHRRDASTRLRLADGSLARHFGRDASFAAFDA